jgi:hypothetical protein
MLAASLNEEEIEWIASFTVQLGALTHQTL